MRCFTFIGVIQHVPVTHRCASCVRHIFTAPHTEPRHMPHLATETHHFHHVTRPPHTSRWPTPGVAGSCWSHADSQCHAADNAVRTMCYVTRLHPHLPVCSMAAAISPFFKSPQPSLYQRRGSTSCARSHASTGTQALVYDYVSSEPCDGLATVGETHSTMGLVRQSSQEQPSQPSLFRQPGLTSTRQGNPSHTPSASVSQPMPRVIAQGHQLARSRIPPWHAPGTGAGRGSDAQRSHTPRRTGASLHPPASPLSSPTHPSP